MDNSDDDYCYIYLDFNERLTSNIFSSKVFLRVANLHKPNPLIQVNDLLFKGSFDECVGTNLFFEEIEDPPLKTNIFEKDTAIRLKLVTSQTKIIKLKQVKLPRQTSTNQSKESIILNLNQEYNTVLEKLEQGVLNLEDVALKEPEKSDSEEFEEMTFEESDESSSEPEIEIETLFDGLDCGCSVSKLEAKYEKLKRLARKPVRRMKSPELIEDCDPQYRKSYEHHNLEKQICQNSDNFRSLSCPIIEKSFIGGIDRDRCVLQGLISPSDLNEDLTKDEQKKIFTIDNWENLSLPARYLIVKKCVSHIEELIENTSSEELKETDENGKTITDICDIFRSLVRALEQMMGQSSESEDACSGVTKTDLSERPIESYVKYRYDPEQEIVLTPEDIFNREEWIDNENKESEEQKQDMGGGDGDFDRLDENIDNHSDQN